MIQATESAVEAVVAGTDLVTAVQQVLAASTQPLTLSKIRARLPMSFRNMDLKELADCLTRQVTAEVVYRYPKYRSRQDRYWDRDMPVHVAYLVQDTLEASPLSWTELRRKLPAYAQSHAQGVFADLLAQKKLHRHPASHRRGGERYSIHPADPKEYVRQELTAGFQRLEQLGFTLSQLRESALELLHEEEWMSPSMPMHASEMTIPPPTLAMPVLPPDSLLEQPTVPAEAQVSVALPAASQALSTDDQPAP